MNIEKYLNNDINYNNNIDINIKKNTHIDIIKELNTNHYKICNDIKHIDKQYRKMRLYYNSINKYYRFLQKPETFTKYGYITIIFCDSTYLPGILVTGFYLKYILKTKYNIICLVQDEPYYEIDYTGSKYLKFHGLNKNEIDDIKKIYDVVIGINLLNLTRKRSNTDLLQQYKNIPYYCTKLFCLGVSEYSKLIFYDASTLIMQNIDYLFDKYNKSTYRINKIHSDLKRGLTGNFYIFIPERYYIHKGIYLIENYSLFFGDLHKAPYFTTDENIIFYSVYPHWDKKVLDENLFYTNSDFYIFPYINKNSKNYNTPIELFMSIKPFLYPLSSNIKERQLFSCNFLSYKKWDIAAAKLIKYFPQLINYFIHINSFRNFNYSL